MQSCTAVLEKQFKCTQGQALSFIGPMMFGRSLNLSEHQFLHLQDFCKMSNEIKSTLEHYKFLYNFLLCGWFQTQCSWSELLVQAQNLNLHCNGKLNGSQFIHYGKENQSRCQAKRGIENQFRLTHRNQEELDKKGYKHSDSYFYRRVNKSCQIKIKNRKPSHIQRTHEACLHSIK